MSPHDPIPAAALDDRLGFVGMTGSGKTFGAGTCVERILAKRARVIIPDPLGVWWGLRQMADGQTPSPYEIVIFGGPHADLPITPHAGAIIGETVASMRESAIIDLSQFETAAAERRFMLAFLDALYRRSTGEPVHLLFDEADLWAPERIVDKEGEATKLHGVMQTVVRRGRIKGLTSWLISQRPAALSKNVLSQVDGLVAFRLTASQDRKALGLWIEGQADREQGKAILGRLPEKKQGEAVVWLPARGILDDATFPLKLTYDSSRAPKRDEKKLAIDLRPLDVDALRGKLETVAKEAVENDPKRLKARIAELERALARKPEAPAAGPAVMRAAVDDAQVRGYAAGRRDGFEAMRKQAATQAQGLRDAIAAVQDTDAPVPPASPRAYRRAPTPRQSPTLRTNGAATTEPLPRGERACLICAAQNDDGVTREQLTVVTGYKRSSRDAYIQRLRERGYVEHAGDRVVATDAGIAALGDAYEPLPTGPALQDYHLGRLPEGQRRVLEILLGAYPDAVERAVIDEATGYKRSSRDAYLHRLGARELVVPEGRGAVRASAILFE
jgi:hypothetical protein